MKKCENEKIPNSFGIDVKTRLFIEYNSLDELRQALAEHKNERLLHIGQGSNLLFTADFNGVILHSGMARAKFLDDETVEAQNGLRLDDLIAQLTDMNYCGMENDIFIIRMSRPIWAVFQGL